MSEPSSAHASQLAAARGIVYRRTTVTDAAALAQQFDDEDVISGTLQLPYPNVDAWRRRLEANVDSAATLSLGAFDGATLAGSAGLFPVTPSPRVAHARGLGISVASAYQGRGIGSELMRRLLDWADNWAGVLRIELTVFTDNARAIALYERFGFQHEGIRRAYALRKGRYSDVHAMARLHPAPPQLPSV